MGCNFLLQGIFPTQRSNPGLLHCRQVLCHLSHQGSHLIKPLFNILRNSEFAPPCDSNPEKSVQLIDVTPPGGGAQEAQCLCFTYVIIFCSYNNPQTRVFSSPFSPWKKLNFRSEVTCCQIYKHSLKHTTIGGQNNTTLSSVEFKVEWMCVCVCVCVRKRERDRECGRRWWRCLELLLQLEKHSL